MNTDEHRLEEVAEWSGESGTAKDSLKRNLRLSASICGSSFFHKIQLRDAE
jgi:hypothetical protein